ncbi:hypothetical protein STCU_12124 [Strigomonas culicis]|uniref:Uncharacterized protein n=1 Tax=Strigomonas culicis TaxID=28005 RepID=S9TEC7_9TRYP|nr:hypothetical protein STCU_12124 [Strigomonas culicis]|eukprot:EPY15319.1 hypothetical protein STCU_12124 [Strigomonas culicis]
MGVSGPPEEQPALRDDGALAVMDGTALSTLPALLGDRLELLKGSPSTVAALVAVLVGKFPSSAMALSFVQRSAPDTLRHAVVLHALLRQCVREADGWRRAVPLLLQYGTARVEPVPTDVLSALVLQLRAARQVSLLVRLLQAYVVPRDCTLSHAALCAMYEAILAHNKAVHRVAQEEVEEALTAAPAHGTAADGEAALALLPPVAGSGGVHWLSALSWATKMQAATKEDRIRVTGTGPSDGAVSAPPGGGRGDGPAAVDGDATAVVHICAEAGSPQGALRAMGYARKVDRTELPLTSEVRAVLYCMLYNRPYEAEAIVAKATREKSEPETGPLRLLLQTVREAKMREERARDK